MKKTKAPAYQLKPKEKILFSQVICTHPVLQEDALIKKNYYKMLVSSMDTVTAADYISASLKLYRKKLGAGNLNMNFKLKMPKYLSVLLPLDIIAVCGYDKALLASPEYQKLLKQVFRITDISERTQNAIRMLYQDFTSDHPAWNIILQSCRKKSIYSWIRLLQKNIAFAEQKPFSILVTATMSAGKSTLINALSGKKIAKTMNEACTGKIHYIYHKPFEDGLVGKWQKKPQLDAEKYILSEKEASISQSSAESVYFSGMLKNERIVLIDSPGVNSAIYDKHSKITEKLISVGNFDMVLYLVNYTADSTDDNFSHLERLKTLVNDTIPVIFVVNKFDEYESGDLLPDEKMKLLKTDIEKAGFKNPKIYPVSALTAFNSRTLFAGMNFSDTDTIMKLMQNGETLKQFSSLQKLIQTDSLHLEQYYSRHTAQKNDIQKMLDIASGENDVSSQALIHSGIYSLETEIISYIKKQKQKGKI